MAHLGSLQPRRAGTRNGSAVVRPLPVDPGRSLGRCPVRRHARCPRHESAVVLRRPGNSLHRHCRPPGTAGRLRIRARGQHRPAPAAACGHHRIRGTARGRCPKTRLEWASALDRMRRAHVGRTRTWHCVPPEQPTAPAFEARSGRRVARRLAEPRQRREPAGQGAQGRRTPVPARERRQARRTDQPGRRTGHRQRGREPVRADARPTPTCARPRPPWAGWSRKCAMAR